MRNTVVLPRFNLKTAVLFWVLLATTAFTSLWSRTSQAEDWIYTLRPGDDVWSIAKQYCGSGNLADDIARHNNLSSPAAIRSGQRINIPVRWLVFEPSSATIADATQGVQLLRYRSQSEAATPGKTLHMGDQLHTLGGSAVVEFADGSRLSIEPNSRVLFNKLTIFGPGAMVDTHLRFFGGRGKAVVQPQNQGDRFRIQTPEGVAAVRGTELRIALTGNNLTNQAESSDSVITETLTGQVDFLEPTQTTAVQAGFGIKVNDGKSILEELLPAPNWQDTNLSIAQENQVHWHSVAQAKSYQVSWFKSQTPDLLHHTVHTQETKVDVNIEPGQYILAVRAISESDISGFDATRTLQVEAPTPYRLDSQLLDPGAEQQTLNLSWSDNNQLTPFEIKIEGLSHNLSQSVTTNDHNALVNLPAGRYQWQVANANKLWSVMANFTIPPPKVQGLNIQANKKTLDVSWQGLTGAEYYMLTVYNSTGQVISSKEVSENSHTVTVPDYSRYVIEVAAVQNKIQGPTVQASKQINPRPWWLLLLLLPLFA